MLFKMTDIAGAVLSKLLQVAHSVCNLCQLNVTWGVYYVCNVHLNFLAFGLLLTNHNWTEVFTKIIFKMFGSQEMQIPSNFQ